MSEKKVNKYMKFFPFIEIRIIEKKFFSILIGIYLKYFLFNQIFFQIKSQIFFNSMWILPIISKI